MLFDLIESEKNGFDSRQLGPDPAGRRAQTSPKGSNFPAEIKMAEEPEVFSGRSIGVLIGGSPVWLRLVYKEEILQQNVFPRFKQVFEAHGCDEVGDWWDLLRAILFGGDVSLQGPKYINRKTYDPKTMRQTFMQSHRDLVVELMTIVFNEQANIPFSPISQPTSFKEIEGSFEFDTSTAKRKATIIYRAVEPDDVYRVIIHGEGKENLFTHTFRFQPSQFWISARYQSNQTGAAAPAGTMGTSDEDSSVGAGEDREEASAVGSSDEDSLVGAGEDACAGDDVCPVGESRRVLRSSRTRSMSAKDEGHEAAKAAKPQAASPRVRRLLPVDDSDDDGARTPRTRSQVGPLGVGPLSAQVSGGGSRRRL